MKYKDEKYKKVKDEEKDTEKDDAPSVRSRQKANKREFLEENNCVEVRPQVIDSSGAIQDFDIAIHEAWVIQCPTNIDINKLVNARIKIPGRRYIDRLKVLSKPYAHPNNLTLGYVKRKGKYDIRNLPLSGQIVISNRLKSSLPALPTESEENHSAPKKIRPKRLKLPVRHPFFGRNYKELTELSEVIDNKLQKAQLESSKASKQLKASNNFYKIRNKLLSVASTLEEKENSVRQSVVTGVAPAFMKFTEHPSYENLLNDNDEAKGSRKQKSLKREHIDSSVEEIPVSNISHETLKKKKKHKKADPETTRDEEESKKSRKKKKTIIKTETLVISDEDNIE